VHEAFGAPTANDPKPTEIVSAKPPEAINEEPPEFKPEGAIWIPGYWDWEVAASKHIWVSGMWRVPPPGMRWVPTYWTEATGGWQRVPGFWVSAQTPEVVYRPTPPESLEVGPSTPSPGADYFYVPGAWNYADSGFRWRAGYWAPYRDDYVWSPDRWYWTPRGSVFTAGYWDWQPGYRGQLFAPIAFNSNIYTQPGWSYRPWCVIDAARFFTHLWIGPGANGYYFGNYYGPWSSRWGFTPWSDWRLGQQGWYDPLWTWSNAYYGRRGIDYIGRTRGWHRYFEQHEHERPALTFDEQRARIAAGRDERGRSQNILAADLREVAQRSDSPLRIARLDDRQRDSVRKLTEELREINRERSRLETADRVASRDDRPERGVNEPGEGRGRGRGEAARLRLPPIPEAVRDAAAGVDLPQTPEATDRPGRTRDIDRTARRQPPRPDEAARTDQPEGSAQPDRDQPERADRPARPDRPEQSDRPDRSGRPERPARPDGPDRPDVPRLPETRGPEAAPPTAPPPPVDAPRPEASRAPIPRTEAPRTETPDVPRTPRIETQRPELPDRPEPSDRRAPRVETPRVETPRVETPRVEAPRAPRADAPRVPRVETSRGESPRATPRNEPARASAPRAAPRTESPRISTAPRSRSERGRSEGSRSDRSRSDSSSRGRDRDEDRD
jgi:hypothetical protein